MYVHPIISQIFRKRGIEDISNLTAEEKATFDNYSKILSKRELSISDIREFCIFQINKIENAWGDVKVEQARKAELIPYHTVYKTLLKAIDAPEIERIALEQVLQAQLNA